MDRVGPSVTRKTSRISLASWAAVIGLGLVLCVIAAAAVAGFFATDPWVPIGISDKRAPVAAVYMSGDMGLRFGMGHHVSMTLSSHDIPVLGVNMATAFSSRRNLRDVDRLIAVATRDAIARTGADRVVLIGQSFGADILAAGVNRLPTGLRPRIAAIVLVVPASSAYFIADPTGLRYRGKPDAPTIAPMRSVGWAPVICIYGTEEADSLCPALVGTKARIRALPGGHMLHRDYNLLTRTILATLAQVRPALW